MLLPEIVLIVALAYCVILSIVPREEESIYRYLKRTIIHFFLFLSIVLFLIYMFYQPFRLTLEALKIESNFLIGFFTLFALLLSLIQASTERRHRYQLKLMDTTEDKGLVIIGKLLTMRNIGRISRVSIIDIRNAISDRRVITQDSFTRNQMDVNENMELVFAYLYIYFREELNNWGALHRKIEIISSLAGTLFANYIGHIDKILRGIPFNNLALDRIEETIQEADSLNMDIEKLTDQLVSNIRSKVEGTDEKMREELFINK